MSPGPSCGPCSCPPACPARLTWARGPSSHRELPAPSEASDSASLQGGTLCPGPSWPPTPRTCPGWVLGGAGPAGAAELWGQQSPLPTVPEAAWAAFHLHSQSPEPCHYRQGTQAGSGGEAEDAHFMDGKAASAWDPAP